MAFALPPVSDVVGPTPPTRRLVLASASPARARVLRDAGFDPTVAVSGVDEDIEAPSVRALVAELALRKARAVAPSHPNSLVLGCDSMLEVAGRGYGKPRTADEARAKWKARAGSSGTLLTGHALIDTVSDRTVGELAETVVHFGRPDQRELDAYLATGEPFRLPAGSRSTDSERRSWRASMVIPTTCSASPSPYCAGCCRRSDCR